MQFFIQGQKEIRMINHGLKMELVLLQQSLRRSVMFIEDQNTQLLPPAPDGPLQPLQSLLIFGRTIILEFVSGLLNY
jgi:hypothetical protein